MNKEFNDINITNALNHAYCNINKYDHMPVNIILCHCYKMFCVNESYIVIEYKGQHIDTSRYSTKMKWLNRYRRRKLIKHLIKEHQKNINLKK